MRAITWVVVALLVLTSIGCDMPATPARPSASAVITPPPVAVEQNTPRAVADSLETNEPEESPVVPTPQPFVSRAEAPATEKADPSKPPGPDYIWVKPYRKAGGITVDGYWLYKPAKPKAGAKAKPEPRMAVNPQPVARNESAPSAGRVWVNGYTRKDGTKVKGYWRNK